MSENYTGDEVRALRTSALPIDVLLTHEPPWAYGSAISARYAETGSRDAAALPPRAGLALIVALRRGSLLDQGVKPEVLVRALGRLCGVEASGAQRAADLVSGFELGRLPREPVRWDFTALQTG